MRFQEIRWFRLKLTAIIFCSAICIIMLTLAINHLYFDFLGLGHDKIAMLKHENTVLQERLMGLNSEMKDLQQTLDDLHREGNRMRLLVDLPSIDEQTREGGSGGAVATTDLRFTSDNVSSLLQSSSSLVDRLTSEAKLQEQNYREILQKCDFNRDYFSAIPALKPMEGFYSTKGFGMRMHPVLGIFKTHEGLDIINDVGTPVYAAGNGVVEMAGQSGGGYGLMVVISHGYDYQTLYAHLSRVLVKEGQRVTRGDLIAKSGKSGLVTGPHLHYEVSFRGVRQNPMDYFLDDVKAQDYRKEIAGQTKNGH
jgi:murein DD-endopeptidase MepM/ murein hydrolase activator NlpD